MTNLNRSETQLQVLSANLKKANDDIELIWQKIFDFDVEEIKRFWNANELEIFIEKMYELNQQMMYIYSYAEDICAIIDKKFGKL